jgi:hypothetical protein
MMLEIMVGVNCNLKMRHIFTTSTCVQQIMCPLVVMSFYLEPTRWCLYIGNSGISESSL